MQKVIKNRAIEEWRKDNARRQNRKKRRQYSHKVGDTLTSEELASIREKLPSK